MPPALFADLTYLGEVVPIEKNKVVAFHYVLENEAGEEVENNMKDEPMAMNTRSTFHDDLVYRWSQVVMSICTILVEAPCWISFPQLGCGNPSG